MNNQVYVVYPEQKMFSNEAQLVAWAKDMSDELDMEAYPEDFRDAITLLEQSGRTTFKVYIQ